MKIEPPCRDYEARSQELRTVFDGDQRVRNDFESISKDERRMIQMLHDDRRRRKRVAELFAMGCLRSADDYFHAAVVFQHGEVPDHFLQAYYWSMKAAELGKDGAHSMAANGLDRYLKSLGYNQLYGGQAIIDDQGCWCLWPIESRFPESERRKMGAQTPEARRQWLQGLNSGKPGCTSGFCDVETKAVAPGLIPAVSWQAGGVTGSN